MALAVAIIGPGALGRSIGALLTRGGARVGYVGRGGPLGPLPAPLDLAILTVKTYDSSTAITAAAPLLGQAPVLSLQNGDQAARAMAAAGIDRGRILLGTTTHAALRRPSGEVVHVAHGDTRIGACLSRAAGPMPWLTAQRVAEALSAHGLATTLEEDMGRAMAQKLAISCGVNAVTSLEGCTNGELLDRPKALARAIAAAEEVLRLYRELRVAVEPREAGDLVREVCRRTAGNRSSMLQDLEAGRPTEIEALNGAVIENALMLDMPINAELLREIREREPGTIPSETLTRHG